MIVTVVEDKYIEGVFEKVKDLLQKPIDRAYGEHTIDEIREMVISGRRQLWAGVDEATGEFVVAAVTQISPRASGAVHMEIILTGSAPHTVDQWFDKSVDALEEYGRLNGADRLIFYGRRGWGKLYNKRGYKEYYVAMSKDLRND